MNLVCLSVLSIIASCISEIHNIKIPTKAKQPSLRAVTGSSLSLSFATNSDSPIYLGRFCFSSLQEQSELAQISISSQPASATVLIRSYADPTAKEPLTTITARNDTFALALSGNLVNMLHLFAFSPSSAGASLAKMSITIGGSYGSCGNPLLTKEAESCENVENIETCKRVQVNYMGDIDRISGTAVLNNGWAFIGKACFQPGVTKGYQMNLQALARTASGEAAKAEILIYFDYDWLGVSLYSGLCEGRTIEPAYRVSTGNQSFVIATEGTEQTLYIAAQSCDRNVTNVTYFISVPKAFACASPGTAAFPMQCLATAGLYCKSYTSGTPDAADLFSKPSKIPAAAIVYGLSFTLYPFMFFVFVAFVVLRNT